MDFSFIGGSMGSVVGEKIARAHDYSIKNKIPFMMISKSGGARMMEAALSLMQLAKTSAKLAQLADAEFLIFHYVQIQQQEEQQLLMPCWAILILLNQDALIGFAGPRVVRDTTGKDFLKDFKRAEFLLEHGFLDYNRKEKH